MFLHPKHFTILCQRLDYQFKNSFFLEQALTRKSAFLEGKQEAHIGHNERLEFFGDSILRTVIDDLLMTLNPKDDEAQLSQKRDKLVSKTGFLLQVADAIELENFILMGNGEQLECMRKGRRKILCDVMEAIIGAIFTDSAKNYLLVKNFIGEHSELTQQIEMHKNQALFHAVVAGDLTEVQHWLNLNANPNSLHHTSYSISNLCNISNGFACRTDVGRPPIRQSRAIDFAIRNRASFNKNTIKIVEALLQGGADPNDLAGFEYSLLHESVVFHPRDADPHIYTEFCRLLCLYGADVNLRCKAIDHYEGEKLVEGVTPLELVAMLGRYEQMPYLLRHHANPNLKNSRGETALHLAARHADKYIAYQEKMLHRGIPFTEKNYLGIFNQIISRFISQGADVMETNHAGERAIDLTQIPSLRRILQAAESSAVVHPYRRTTRYGAFDFAEAERMHQQEQNPESISWCSVM